jgi:hypothetical protein
MGYGTGHYLSTLSRLIKPTGHGLASIRLSETPERSVVSGLLAVPTLAGNARVWSPTK